jgi:L-2,4-diaminobutyric acid acetyltransferase
MAYLNPRAPEGAGAATAHTALRAPKAEDGERVWRLIADCPPLDRNSLYCNLLQCTDFADTCILAEKGDDLVGWVSAYRPPNDPGALFVWQVAVHEKARGEGLAQRMIENLAARHDENGVTKIKATITKDNRSSWKLFESIARNLSAPLVSEERYKENEHFGGRHETEYLVTIGPFGALRRS